MSVEATSQTPTQKTRPLVSVVIPVLNGEDTIARGIESVFAQDYPAIECIVVDDASQDSTADILRSFGDRITAVFNETNRGTAGAYNIGTGRARGEFVLLMASDCHLTDPAYVSAAVSVLEDESIAGLCGQGVFSDLHTLNRVQRVFTVVNLLDVDDNPDDGLFEVSFIETRCDLVRRRALEEIGFWFEGLYNSTEDQDISARMRQLGYRLVQDKRLKFALDFGQTEDNLRKVIKKQYKYANGQGYIFLKYGLGHHLMTGDQDNRHSRIVHRIVQVALGPIAAVGVVAGATGTPAVALLATALLAARGLYYWRSAARWLKGADRVFCAGMGLVCDLTYGLSFLAALVTWTISDPRIVRFGRPMAGDSKPGS